jgi:hypothetical protein
LDGQITASDYVDILGNQVHPVVQVLFLTNDAVFQDNISPTHTQPEVFSLALRSMKMHLKLHLWLAQSPNLNVIEPL